MLLQLIIAMISGIFAGTLTGLIPGIHTNLIGILVVSLSASLFALLNPIYFVVFIVAMAITHTFIDFIPSVFLGCPDTDTELSILPGHELLKKGFGHEAVSLTCYGSLAAVFILVLIAFPSIFFISKSYQTIQKIIPFLLIIVSGFLICMEREKFSAIIIFLMSGLLGWSVLNFHGIKEPLLPLLTGLFGSSTLILSIKNKTIIPPQKTTKTKTPLSKPLLGSIIASPICSFLPGLGSSQAAIIGNTISKTDRKGFLVLIGATNTLVMGFSFISLYVISRTRTGAAAAVQNLLTELKPNILILILIVILITGVISFYLTLFLSEFFSKNITKINYALLSLITLFLLTNVVVFVSGFRGLIILTVSTFMGIYAISKKVRRTNMMGCLLIPTIILYLF